MTHIYDITVIGGGPVGLFTTFYAGLRDADVLLLESLSDLGGQTGNLYPAKKIYDVGGFLGVSGEELVTRLKDQATHFNPTIQTATKVLAIEQQPGGEYALQTNNGTYYSRTVIIATGGGAFTPRKLAVDYDAALEDHQLLYFIRSLDVLKGKTIAIAGGGDSAIDWALELLPIAKEVHLIHRRDQFRGLESSVTALKASPAILHTPYLIDQVTKTESNQLHVQLKKIREAETTELTVDYLLVNYGFISDNKQLQTWGVDVARNAIVVDQQMQTNRPGIFAVGDAVTYPGKLDLIASGFGEAPTAVSGALSFIDPDRIQALHSSQLYH